VVGFYLHPLGGAIALIITTVIYYRKLQTIFAHYSRRQSATSLLIGDLTDDIDPVISHCNRGKFRYQTGNHELAIADFDRAIELDPDALEAYYYRGLARKNLGKVTAAKEDLHQAAILCERSSNIQLYEQISTEILALQQVEDESLN
jgi:tetratricopeptide (TPR) repeat protein